MDLAAASGIGATLNANEAPIELVLDMADTLQDYGLLHPDYRSRFVQQATASLRERIEHIDSQITKAVRGW